MADDLHMTGLPPPAASTRTPADRAETGWLLRTLKPGEAVVLVGDVTVTIELRDHKGRPRLAIKAPASVRAIFPGRVA